LGWFSWARRCPGNGDVVWFGLAWRVEQHRTVLNFLQQK
jgi:hypothetical protein